MNKNKKTENLQSKNQIKGLNPIIRLHVQTLQDSDIICHCIYLPELIWNGYRDNVFKGID